MSPRLSSHLKPHCPIRTGRNHGPPTASTPSSTVDECRLRGEEVRRFYFLPKSCISNHLSERLSVSLTILSTQAITVRYLDTMWLHILLVASATAFILAVRQRIYPRPYPGIPYNEQSAHRISGDLPELVPVIKSTNGYSTAIFSITTQRFRKTHCQDAVSCSS